MTGPTKCLETAAVLAHFLDGEPTEPAELARLTAHRSECAVCDRSLAAARRVDALVASSAETRVPPRVAMTMLRSAMSPAKEPERSRGMALASMGLALLSIGFVSAWWLASRTSSGPLPGVRPEIPEGPHRPIMGCVSSATDGIVLARGPRGDDWISLGTAAAVPGPTVVSSVVCTSEGAGLAEAVRPLTWLRAASIGLGRLLDPLRAPDRLASHVQCVARAVRLGRARALFESHRPDAIGTVVGLLGTWTDEEAVAALGRRVRASSRHVEWIRGRLRDRRVAVEVLVAAVRVGLADVDQDVRQFVSREPAMVGDVVRTVRTSSLRAGSARLLIEIWDELAARGVIGEDFAVAVDWFGGLDCAAAAEVLVEFERGRSDRVRRLCLLALGALGGAHANAALATIVDGPRLYLAEIAAFALGRAREGAELLAGDLHSPRRRYLRLAALADRHDARIATMVAKLRVTPEERSFLAAGDFSFAQFRIAATLFRERAASDE